MHVFCPSINSIWCIYVYGAVCWHVAVYFLSVTVDACEEQQTNGRQVAAEALLSMDSPSTSSENKTFLQGILNLHHQGIVQILHIYTYFFAPGVSQFPLPAGWWFCGKRRFKVSWYRYTLLYVFWTSTCDPDSVFKVASRKYDLK